jgi:hypothetical protein
MTLSRSARRRLASAAVLLAPALLVQSYRLLGGSGPATSDAAIVATTDPAALPSPVSGIDNAPRTTITPAAAAKVSAWIDHHRTGPERFLRSPMDNPPAAEKAPEPPAPEPAATPAPADQPTTELRLGAIIAGGDDTASAAALINGFIRRVGDEVEPGWSIATIDAKSMTVRLIGPGDRHFTLRRP